MIRTIRFTLNDKPVSIEVDDEQTLLWVLRTDLGLTGAKDGCGEGLFGACTVLMDVQDGKRPPGVSPGTFEKRTHAEGPRRGCQALRLDTAKNAHRPGLRDILRPPKGGGEPAIVCMGGEPATGAIVRQLPMTPERVNSALTKTA